MVIKTLFCAGNSDTMKQFFIIHILFIFFNDLLFGFVPRQPFTADGVFKSNLKSGGINEIPLRGAG